MSDNADIANDIIQQRLDDALAQRVQPGTGPSANYCADCDVRIPEARRSVVQGTQHCAECAGMLEQRRRFGGGR